LFYNEAAFLKNPIFRIYYIYNIMGCQKFDKNFCNFLEVIHSEKSNYSEKIGANYYPFGLKHKGYYNSNIIKTRAKWD